MKRFAFMMFLSMIPLIARADVVTQPVEYKDGETALEGYLAYDDSIQGKRPGVLVFHEWKGLNDYSKGRARQLAELGYVALAADMYGKGILAKDHEEASRLSGVYRNDRSLMRGRANASLEVLKNNALVDPDRIAAIGYCFGGTAVLEMARAGFDLAGVVSFHGGLSAPLPAQKGDIQAKVLVLHGAIDPNVKPEELASFQAEMNLSGADWQVVIFGGAVHGFTVPEAGSDKSRGVAYDEKADKRSWEIMKHFLEEIFPRGHAENLS